MTVGQTLTEARSQAGLTVDELSERTRIRETVIRSIEQDDFEACGGDLYVRGYVRALAGAVGIDAQPLIREYELERAGQGTERASGSVGRHAKGYSAGPVPDGPTAFDLPAAAGDPAAEADPGTTRFDLPAVLPVPPDAVPPAAAQPPGSADTRFDLPVVPPVPSAAEPPWAADTRFDLPPVTGDLMAAGYDLGPQQWPDEPGDSTAAMPAYGREQTDAQGFTALPGAMPFSTAQFDAVPPGGTAPQFSTGDPAATRSASMRKSNRRAIAAAVFAVIALAALGVRLATAGPAHSTASAGASASAASASAAAAQARASAAANASAAASASAAAQASASQASASQVAAQAVTRLPVAAVQAYGPDGFADGDDPGDAKDAISAGASQPWATQWYATPEFGMLKHGTGLLLDLGGQVTVSSVVIDLSKYSGASLQIRVGNGTAPQDLQVAATASDAGGVVRLTLPHPVAARYLLIWFTQLPPDGAGHYQETVSQVQVTGRR